MILNRDTLAVSELFTSLQGEGLSLGKPAIFIRLGGCNLNCGSASNAKWVCDSVRLWTQAEQMTFAQIVETIYETSVDRIVLTGGEPLLQLTSIFDFVRYLHKKMSYIKYLEIETNGTSCMTPDDIKYIKKYIPNIMINCSPKLSNSGIIKERRIRDSALQGWTALRDNHEIDLVFKFVVFDEQDINEVEKDFGNYIFTEKGELQQNVFFMPAADNREDLQKVTAKLWPIIVERGYNLTTRLHILAFDKKVGV